MTTDQHKTVSGPPATSHRKPVAKVLFISALTSVLVAIVWRVHADSLSAEEQQLVGTWRRFDADGNHRRDERYSPNRSVERRLPIGADSVRAGRWIEVPSVRWAFSSGDIRLHRPVTFDEWAHEWTGGRYVYLGNFAFPKTSFRQSRTTCIPGLKPIGLSLHYYSIIPVRYPKPAFGESIQVTSDEFSGEVHTLCRLVSAMQTDSPIGWPSDD